MIACCFIPTPFNHNKEWVGQIKTHCMLVYYWLSILPYKYFCSVCTGKNPGNAGNDDAINVSNYWKTVLSAVIFYFFLPPLESIIKVSVV